MFSEILKKSNITQLELARKLGISQQAVSTWCIGKSQPSLAQVAKLADVLNTTVNNIIDSLKRN